MQKTEIENEIARLTQLANLVPLRYGTPILKKVATLIKQLESKKVDNNG